MILQTATKIAGWLEATYIEYLKYIQSGGKRIQYKGNLSGNWDSNGKLRVSKIANSCPKIYGAEIQHKIQPEELSTESLIRMTDAERVAEIIYESIEWGCQYNPDFSMEAEVRIKDHFSELVGTTDMVLSYKNEMRVPIECKRTGVDKYFMKPRGIVLSHVIQTIGEMILLSTEENKTPFGFVFTRFSPESQPPLKVWTILRVDGGWQLYDKEWIVNEDKWPTFISDTYYQILVRTVEFYAQSNDPIAEAPPYEFGQNYKCCGVTKAEYYSPKGKNKGRKKDKTGIIEVRCPLFNICFKKEIELMGYDSELQQKEYELNDKI